MALTDLPDDAFDAYLAGFTDGEGYIGVAGRNLRCGVRIVLANCVRDVLEQIRDRLGYGAIRSQQLRSHWRERHLYIVSNGADCRDLALRIRPYVVIKADPLDELLATCAAWQETLDGLAERDAEILRALAAGEQGNSIAARLGTSPMTVSRVKKRGTVVEYDLRAIQGRGHVAGLQPSR